MFSAAISAHPQASGFVPVTGGADAFLLRSALAGLAERTLDLQYYIWEDDLTGRIMLRDVMRAAQRGVRVRILLDDVHAVGETDAFRVADAHPLIEVRLFNPFGLGELRAAEWLLDGDRLNHRMHNKALIADNAIAVTGGRNIADHYFAVHEASNFRDLDLLAVGPLVPALSAMFDVYWNSEWSYPIAALAAARVDATDARRHLAFLEDWVAARPSLPFALDANADAMRARLQKLRTDFLWGPAYAVYDSPERVDGTDPNRVAEFLFDTANGVRDELLIETAYFIPGPSGVELLASLVERGVDVKVLTNSLATNDVMAAHAGYMSFREDLLRAGIGLFELRPDAAAEQRHWTPAAAESSAALHTKALVYDRRAVFVGSFNLDPRSLLINTEMGVLVQSPKLAQRLAAMIELGMDPANSYRVALRDGELRWLASDDGRAVCFDADPQTSALARLNAWFLSLLPIKGQL